MYARRRHNPNIIGSYKLNENERRRMSEVKKRRKGEVIVKEGGGGIGNFSN